MVAQTEVLTVADAENWREFLRDAVREAKIQLARAEKACANTSKGTAERRAQRKEVRERNNTYATLRAALADVSMQMGATEAMDNNNVVEPVYKERAQCVVALARIAKGLGYAVGFAEDVERSGWPVLYIELPTGQVSWHFTSGDREEYAADILDNPDIKWDGHSTPEKYARLAAWSRTIASLGGIK